LPTTLPPEDEHSSSYGLRTPLLASLIPLVAIALMCFAAFSFQRRRQHKRFDVVEGVISKRREARQRARLLDGEDFVTSDHDHRSSAGWAFHSEESYRDTEKGSIKSPLDLYISSTPSLPSLRHMTYTGLPAGARAPESPGLGLDFYIPHLARPESRPHSPVASLSSHDHGQLPTTSFSRHGAIQTPSPSHSRHDTSSPLAHVMGPGLGISNQSTSSHSRQEYMSPPTAHTTTRPFLPSRTSETGTVFHEHTHPPPLTPWVDPVLNCGSFDDLRSIVDEIMGASSCDLTNASNKEPPGVKNGSFIDLDLGVSGSTTEDRSESQHHDLPGPSTHASGWGRQRSSSSLSSSPSFTPGRFTGMQLTVANPSPASPPSAIFKSSPLANPSVDAGMEDVEVPRIQNQERRGSVSSWMERPPSTGSTSTLMLNRERRNWLERSPVGRSERSLELNTEGRIL
jgi:hypothetical protein